MKRILLDRKLKSRLRFIKFFESRSKFLRRTKSFKIDTRKKEIKFRKNFLPTLLITGILSLAIFYLIFYVDPESFGAVVLFFILTFLFLLFIFSTLFANTRRGVIASFTLVLYLVLRYYGIGHILNLALIIGLALTAEIYLSRN